MTKVITTLTKEQEEQIPKFIDKWVKQASTPTDRADLWCSPKDTGSQVPPRKAASS